MFRRCLGIGERPKGNQVIRHDPARDEVFLNDSFQHGWIAATVPGAFGIDDGDGSSLTNPETVDLGAQDTALLRKLEFLQSALEEVPGDETALAVATLRFGLVTAQKDVTAGQGDAY